MRAGTALHHSPSPPSDHPPPSPPPSTPDFSLTLTTPPPTSLSPPPLQTDPRLFPCLFCNKIFLKSQALGGHQNAHKKERSLSWSSHRLYLTPPPPPSFTSVAAAAGLFRVCRGGAYGQRLFVPAVGGDAGEGCETMDFLNWQRGSLLSQWEENGDGEADEEEEAEVDLSLRL